MAPRECPTKTTLSNPSRSRSADRSRACSGMPPSPEVISREAPRPRRSGTRKRQPPPGMPPFGFSSSTSASKAPACPVRPWTRRATLDASPLPHSVVINRAAWFSSMRPPSLCALHFAAEHDFGGIPAWLLGEPLQGDADALVVARCHLRVRRGEPAVAFVVHGERARADAPLLPAEPQLVVLVRPRLGQAPHLQLRLGGRGGAFDLDLPARAGREPRGLQG